MHTPGADAPWRKSSAIVTGLVLVLAFFFGGGLSSARGMPEDHKLDQDFLKRFGHDFIGVVGAPLRWDSRDFLALAAVSGAGLLLFTFDGDIKDWFQQRRSAASNEASTILSYLGNGGVLAALSAAVYAAGEISDKDKLRQTALLSVESLATATILVWTMKAATGRARPYADESSRSFHPFSFESRHWSLPSGHAAAAFAVATAVAEQSKNVAVDALAYGLATLAGLSRIHDNKHWASDVLIGSAVGYFTAKKICDLNSAGGHKRVGLGLQFSPGRQALTLTFVF
ncbi:MAG: phosphatase PAP2 family protein [Acidobacteriota bacterium]